MGLLQLLMNGLFINGYLVAQAQHFKKIDELMIESYNRSYITFKE